MTMEAQLLTALIITFISSVYHLINLLLLC